MLLSQALAACEDVFLDGWPIKNRWTLEGPFVEVNLSDFEVGTISFHDEAVAPEDGIASLLDLPNISFAPRTSRDFDFIGLPPCT
jgi:hypothetical protein